jgi:hypothetical protein
MTPPIIPGSIIERIDAVLRAMETGDCSVGELPRMQVLRSARDDAAALLDASRGYAVTEDSGGRAIGYFGPRHFAALRVAVERAQGES